MNGQRFNPLTPAHADLVTQGCAQCVQLSEYLDTLDRIGIPTEEYREKLAGFEHMFTRIRDTYISPPS